MKVPIQPIQPIQSILPILSILYLHLHLYLHLYFYLPVPVPVPVPMTVLGLGISFLGPIESNDSSVNMQVSSFATYLTYLPGRLPYPSRQLCQHTN